MLPFIIQALFYGVLQGHHKLQGTIIIICTETNFLLCQEDPASLLDLQQLGPVPIHRIPRKCYWHNSRLHGYANRRG